MQDYVHLGIRGFFLEPEVYLQQREASNRLQRGVVLVLLLGFLVGLTSLIGQITTSLVSPDTDQIAKTVYDGLIKMPWYTNVTSSDQAFADEFKKYVDMTGETLKSLEHGGMVGGFMSLIATPITFLLVWVFYGLFMHMVARMFGGTGSLSQTLGCTALAAGANLLSLIQIVPFVQVSGVFLMSLLANYLAIRIAHELPPRQAVWTIIFGPVLLVVLAGVLGCIVLFMVVKN
jgi:hypothetical protein